MNTESVTARHYATGESLQVRWNDGKIVELRPGSKISASKIWIAPSLVDLQINGFGGIDFQQDALSAGELLTAVRAIQAAGCAQFLLTLVTDDWSRLTCRLSHLRSLRNTFPEIRRAIAGWHIEGPFLSAEPGFHGAHDPIHMCDPNPEKIHTLRNLTESDPLLLTLAPERKGAIDAIRLARSLGITISLGHANPSAAILREAVDAGATGFTHLGNACPQALDRHDNLLWRVFDSEGLTVGLIPDQIHVSPALFRLVHKILPPGSVYFTTDAMSAAGAPSGSYTIGSIEVEVGEDRIVRQPGKTNFAGSALRPIEGVQRAARMLKRRWQDVWDSFSTIPARFMGLHSGISEGNPASFCVLETRDTGEIENAKTFVFGEIAEQDRRL
ncbi:MAG: N-acetylglucosamine-6-phosphate deacetylase [Verrucomicrobia bacterium]|nr:N-acetylglucosamine-6-phosphate deacetylase [Verrucomicrobiota bacterium]